MRLHDEQVRRALRPLTVTRDGVEALYAVGHRLLSAESYRRAVGFFRLMVLSAPEDERAWLGLAACHEGVDEGAIALEIYEAAVAAVPVSARCHVARARLQRALGDLDGAEESLERARDAADEAGDDELTQLVARERGVA